MNKITIKSDDSQTYVTKGNVIITVLSKPKKLDKQRLLKRESSLINKPRITLYVNVKWDGSCLGKWKDIKLQRTVQYQDGIHYLFTHNDIFFDVLTKFVNSPYACVVDECKQVFGLRKRGTHWFRRGDTAVIIYKPIFETAYPLNKIARPIVIGDVIRDIRYNFVFKLIMGIQNIRQSDILVVSNKDSYEIIGINETRVTDLNEINSIPEVIHNQWFNEISIEEVIRELCLITDPSMIMNFLAVTRREITKIVSRVDKQLITLVDMVMTKLTDNISDGTESEFETGIKGPPVDS